MIWTMQCEYAQYEPKLFDEFICLYVYTEVHEKICNSEGQFGIVHNSCRASFSTKYNSCLQTFGNRGDENELLQETATNNAQTFLVKGRLCSSSISERDKCFICFERCSNDSQSYKDGGLTRCCEDTSADRLLQKKELYLVDKLHPFYKAALRSDLQLKGDSHDIFYADIYYHKSCCLRFAHPYETLTENEVKQALETFFSLKDPVINKPLKED